MIIVPSTLITMRAYSLEHKERYSIVIGEEMFILRFDNTSEGTFLPCHLIQYMFIFPLRVIHYFQHESFHLLLLIS